MLDWFAGIPGGIGSIIVAALTAYFTATMKIRAEKSKLDEAWKSTVLEKYTASFDEFQKFAQQFAIGIVFFEDPARDGHHQKIFVPKNFNLTIGRSEENDIQSADQTVSRLHALLSSDDARVYIEDLFATNPTRINDRPIAGRTPLKDNDVIMIGAVTLKFKTLAGWQGRTV